MKLRTGSVLTLCFLLMIFLGACTAGKKKPKCRTCPKWEDAREFRADINVYEEEHGSGTRP
jgi:hypothetical protein